MHNKNTTIDKVALELFNKHFGELNKTQQQACNQEMVNNPKWLAPFWKQPDYKSETDKLCEELGIFNYKNCAIKK
jgi:hypothetical protein